MIKNYLKIAARYLLKHKGYTAINILGLAVGVASCILIMLFVKSEWNYDCFHTKSDLLYRVWMQENYGTDKIYTDIATPIPLGPAIKANMPDVVEFTRVNSFSSNVKAINQTASNEDIDMVDVAFFKMFDFELTQGNPNNPFPTANSIIITKEKAKKYFGNTDPIGLNLELQMRDDKVLYTVSGVVDHVPEESSIQFDMLMSFDNAHYLFSPEQMTAWTQIYPESFVLLKQPETSASFAPKFESLIKVISGDNYQPGVLSLYLQPISDIYFGRTVPPGNGTSTPVYSYVLATIGILILLIACINFITLSIGRSTNRAMEVGVRKVMGAERKQLIQQFWTEAFLFTITSVVIGFLFALLFLDPFNNLFQRHLSLTFDPVVILFFIALLLFIAFVVGIYPSLVLSSFNPTEVFKGKLKGSGSVGLFRRSLIAGQFIASISMIICTLVISGQLNYMKNKNLGYNKEQVVIVPMNKGGVEASQMAMRFRNELNKIPQVKEATTSLYSFSENSWIHMGFRDEQRKYGNLNMNEVDEDFIPAMNIQIVEGRNFQKNNTADKAEAVIVNEAFVNEFKIGDPIGKKLPGNFSQHVIGVMKDFNYESLHVKVKPLVLALQADSMANQTNDININVAPQPRVSVRLAAGSLSAGIELLHDAWKKIAADQDFDYRFLDESIAAQYANEQRVSNIILLASVLSIFIACMGLFGLATLVVNRRTKEIGIRKILGASYAHVLSIISKDFMITVAIASVIAFPLAFYAMNKWLQNFEYRISMSWWMFLIAAISALLITLITVGFQAMKAANANPVKSLRTE
ncbi:MAG: ABC transporter permease [Chitinophagales bacterium]|nr:ABC transporter permease [Chitinophagales bacterium]